MNASKPGNEDVFLEVLTDPTLVHAYVYVYVLGHKRDQPRETNVFTSTARGFNFSSAIDA